MKNYVYYIVTRLLHKYMRITKKIKNDFTFKIDVCVLQPFC